QREMASPRSKQSGFYEAYGGFQYQIDAHSAMGELNQVRQLLSSRNQPLETRWLTFWAGDLEGPAVQLPHTVNDLRSKQQLESVCWQGWLLAQYLRLAGHYNASEEILREGLSYSFPGGYVPLEIRGRQCLSHVCAQMGRIEEARANLARCREIMAAGE